MLFGEMSLVVVTLLNEVKELILTDDKLLSYSNWRSTWDPASWASQYLTNCWLEVLILHYPLLNSLCTTWKSSFWPWEGVQQRMNSEDGGNLFFIGTLMGSSYKSKLSVLHSGVTNYRHQQPDCCQQRMSGLSKLLEARRIRRYTLHTLFAISTSSTVLLTSNDFQYALTQSVSSMCRLYGTSDCSSLGSVPMISWSKQDFNPKISFDLWSPALPGTMNH